jgi:hypothetical protein
MDMLYFEHLLDVVGLGWLSLETGWTAGFDSDWRQDIFLYSTASARPSLGPT